jgi:hypothetical protein
VAVVLLFRVAIMLAPFAYRAVQAEQRSAHPGWQELIRFYRDRLFNHDEDDAALAADMSTYAGYAVSVTTFSGAFEMRKVQFIWSVQDQTVATEDARVCTFHLLKLAAGVPTDVWVAADFTALDAAYTAWWGAITDRFSTKTTWDRLKVYKAGPAIVPPQPPVYDADKNVPGIAASSPLPPQVAISVTEIAGFKRYWGRFYLPNPCSDSGALNTFGRISSACQTDIATATDTLYTSLTTAGLVPVVYRAALPERETKAGTTLPARTASAWTVEKIQVDDVFDVIRRRRFKYPTLREQRDI